MSDAPILQTARTPISEWSDSSNMIVEQSKVKQFSNDLLCKNVIIFILNSYMRHSPAAEVHC